VVLGIDGVLDDVLRRIHRRAADHHGLLFGVQGRDDRRGERKQAEGSGGQKGNTLGHEESPELRDRHKPVVKDGGDALPDRLWRRRRAELREVLAGGFGK
jgi:hypothetical protein